MHCRGEVPGRRRQRAAAATATATEWRARFASLRRSPRQPLHNDTNDDNNGTTDDRIDEWEVFLGLFGWVSVGVGLAFWVGCLMRKEKGGKRSKRQKQRKKIIKRPPFLSFSFFSFWGRMNGVIGRTTKRKTLAERSPDRGDSNEWCRRQDEERGAPSRPWVGWS